jgi:iron complex outermembrane recepter protein
MGARWIPVAMLLLVPSVSVSQQPTPRDLASMELEELAQIKVTAASRKPEPVGQVAAALHILTRDDIRRSTATSLPELLRLVPGLHVARGGARDWTVSARGLFTSLSADKLLVLVDGRPIYSPIFAGVFWDVQDVVLADVERVEVILGPGASVWGSNAVNGVINVITLRATQTIGGQLAADVGTEDRVRVRGRYGIPAGGGAAVRVYGQYLDRDGAAVLGGGDARNDWEWGTVGARFDTRAGARDGLSAQAQAFWATGEQQRLLPAPDPPYRQLDEGDLVASGAYARVRWTRELSERSGFALQAYVDRTRRTDGGFWRDSRVDVAELDFQHRFAAGARHDIVWGAGYRLIDDDNPATYTLAFLPQRRTVSLAQGFLQDDIDLGGGRWYLTLGTRLERSSYTDLEVQPTVRLRWSPALGHTAWAAVSRAVRSPSRLDMDLREVAGTIPSEPPITVVAQGVDRFEPERLIAYEIGYRGEPARNFGLDASTFLHTYRRLRTLVPEAPDPATGTLRYVIRNGAYGDSWGGTLAATWRVVPRWRLRASYTYQHVWSGPSADRPGEVVDAVDGLSPAHQASLHSAWDIARAVELDLYFRWVDELEAFAIPDYAQADARVSWRPSESLTLAIIGQDLLAERHQEFRADVFVPQAREIERRVLGRVAWRF